MSSRESRFAGSTVVVTGGAGGIGHAVCQGFAIAGANDVRAGLTEEQQIASKPWRMPLTLRRVPR